MRANEKQIRAAKSVQSIAWCWENTNDIDSPSHYTIIEDEFAGDIATGDIEDTDAQKIINHLSKIYDVIRKL